MAITTEVREAKLKPECAERYPTLPARMWTSATCLVGLVNSYRAADLEGRDKPHQERTLSESDFEFRGGLPRYTGGGFTHTRVDELGF